MLWSKLTWEEIPSRLEAASFSAILPVGATEQHGPHLNDAQTSLMLAVAPDMVRPDQVA